MLFFKVKTDTGGGVYIRAAEIYIIAVYVYEEKGAYNLGNCSQTQDINNQKLYTLRILALCPKSDLCKYYPYFYVQIELSAGKIKQCYFFRWPY